MNKELAAAFGHQIRNELDSHYSYLGMSAYLETTPYTGFAKWMRVQSEEEYGHAMKLFDYLNERDEAVTLEALNAPTSEFSGPLSVFEQALRQEQEVTGQIDKLFATAVEVSDFAAQSFLNWFLEEQVEEEKITFAMVEKLRLVGDHPSGLLRLDGEAARRKG